MGQENEALYQSVQGYPSLSTYQQSLLKSIHARHMRAFGTEKRKLYTVDQIRKVIGDEEADCLKIYFKNGDWWHYLQDGTWF
ncbi:hypothetical protein [Paenibacillus sp. HB172176]|uniref:hypothetical protein n=1 Tax=Paenibacillus sp. HB172176 TaxID=2493690 RepID=UPI00143BA655|nr:hypothetical protein [Paenibacillus sp. HB172176]